MMKKYHFRFDNSYIFVRNYSFFHLENTPNIKELIQENNNTIHLLIQQ